jgi:hypothetical protein
MIGDPNPRHPPGLPRPTGSPPASPGIAEPFFPEFLLSTACFVPPFPPQSGVYFRYTQLDFPIPSHCHSVGCETALLIVSRRFLELGVADKVVLNP